MDKSPIINPKFLRVQSPFFPVFWVTSQLFPALLSNPKVHQFSPISHFLSVKSPLFPTPVVHLLMVISHAGWTLPDNMTNAPRLKNHGIGQDDPVNPACHSRKIPDIFDMM